MSREKVIRSFKKYSSFLITSHVNLEGDALGSELALASLLRKLGKTVYIINSDKTPSNYSFLPGVKKICSVRKYFPKEIIHRLNREVPQAVVVVDCADKQRIGEIIDLIQDHKVVINIDHHLANRNFGTINWVDPQASSAGEMVYRLFKLTRTKLDKEDILNLYTAILTDTGSFRYHNTSSTALSICSKFLDHGIDPAKVYQRIYENNSLQDMTVLRRIISEIRFAAHNKIAWVKINRGTFRRIKGKPEISDKILDFGRCINTVKVVIIFVQMNRGVIKLSLRSKSPINVQKIASAFGGGGHKFASGCRIKATFKQAQNLVLKQVKKAL